MLIYEQLSAEFQRKLPKKLSLKKCFTAEIGGLLHMQALAIQLYMSSQSYKIYVSPLKTI
jgi:hypothetical protein